MPRYEIQYNDGSHTEVVADTFQPQLCYNSQTNASEVSHLMFYEYHQAENDIDEFDPNFIGRGRLQIAVALIKANNLKSVHKIPEV